MKLCLGLAVGALVGIAGLASAQPAVPVVHEPLAVAVFVSPGVLVDGGGYWIDGQGHVHPVPPRDPGIRELSALARLAEFVKPQPTPWRELRPAIEARAARLRRQVLTRMSTPRLRLDVDKTLVLIYLSPGVARGGGGFGITPGGKIVPVPPRPPALEQLANAAALLSHVAPGPVAGPGPDPWRSALRLVEEQARPALVALPEAFRALEAAAE
jgi:hypothetical protein